MLYPHVAPKQAYDAGRLGGKVPAIMDVPEQGYRFVEEVAPAADDVLVPKRHPSAFFGTALVSYLIDREVDTVIVTGCTTSGCVRATAVDAFSYNFHVLVPEECVYDRSPTVHAVNLFDIAQKYADVMPAGRVVAAVRGMAGAHDHARLSLLQERPGRGRDRRGRAPDRPRGRRAHALLQELPGAARLPPAGAAEGAAPAGVTAASGRRAFLE